MPIVEKVLKPVTKTLNKTTNKLLPFDLITKVNVALGLILAIAIVYGIIKFVT